MTSIRLIPVRLFTIVSVLFAMLLASPAIATQDAAPAQSPSGVLVVTADRGFLGNAEVKDAFDAFAKNRNAELL